MKRFSKHLDLRKAGVTSLAVVAAFSLTLGLSACGNNNDSSGDSGAAASSETQAEEATCVYEGIFLDNDEIQELFTEVRGKKAPYKNVTQDFHVTSQFMPEEAHTQWYGQQVTVHITAYAKQKVKMDDGKMTANEGFKVELDSDNQELNDYLASLDNNYHITGAYKDGAKYTGQVDFSKGEKVDYTVTGTFGGYYSDNAIKLSAE